MNSNRWLQFEQVYGELREMSGNMPAHYEGKVAELTDKLERIADMKRNLNDQDYLLKKQYIKLMRQKSMFASKLNQITVLGNNLQWEEKSHTMQRIKPIIESAKQRLRVDNKLVTNESRVSTQQQH